MDVIQTSGVKTNKSGQKELGADSTESDTVKENWGMLLKYESYGRHGDTKNNFKIISRQEAITTYAPFEHVAHGMFFARDERKIWKEQPVRASVLMQMRFDGRLGFPGGHVDHGEDIVAGLNREVHEELGLDISNASEDRFAEEDYAVIYVHKEKKFVLHFFVKEITKKAFQGMLGNSLNAHEYGKEAAGYFRPPLYMRSDTMEGFPAFLSHQFAGNAKEELFVGLLRADIYSREEIEHIIHLCDGS